MDGGILIGTAYLREPYGEHTEVYGYHDPNYRGVLAVPRENVIEIARAANQLGWQMTAHVTGGGSLDVLLDAYEAALSFEEKSKGSIEPGKLADLIVISKDFLSCPMDEIKDIEALLTVVDGKEVYRANVP